MAFTLGNMKPKKPLLRTLLTFLILTTPLAFARVVVDFSLDGYLAARRQVVIPWNDYRNPGAVRCCSSPGPLPKWNCP